MMKINEKVLIKYAQSTNCEVDKEGWLLKKSESKNEFQKRYCVLKGNLFYYFEKPTSEPLGCIILEGCRIELEEETNEHPNLFSFRIAFSPKSYKNYLFASDSQVTCESWMKSLSSCSIGHMRHILSELAKQVEDLEQDEKLRNRQLTVDEEHFDSKFTRRINPFDAEDSIVALNGERGALSKIAANHRNAACFSRRPFVELHTHYGLQFQEFFNQRSQSKSEIVNDLILL